jgi:hypothetical protein
MMPRSGKKPPLSMTALPEERERSILRLPDLSPLVTEEAENSGEGVKDECYRDKKGDRMDQDR